MQLVVSQQFAVGTVAAAESPHRGNALLVIFDVMLTLAKFSAFDLRKIGINFQLSNARYYWNLKHRSFLVFLGEDD